MTAILLLRPAHAALAQEGAEEVGVTIENTRQMLDRWGDVRRTISKEKNEWALTKEILQARIELLQRSIEEVTGQIESQKKELAGFDERIATLESQNEKLKQASEQLAQIVARMESRTLQILEGSPDPLKIEVKPLAVQIPGFGPVPKDTQEQAPSPDNPSTTEQDKEASSNDVPLSRRVENVVGVLYLLNKYAGKVDQTVERVTRADGASLSVDTIYLGLSYGFYVDDDNKSAACGKPGASGWGWTPVDDAAQRIREVIKVYNKDQPAAFIQLPVEVDK